MTHIGKLSWNISWHKSHDRPWNFSLEIHEISWESIDVHGIPCSSVEVHGLQPYVMNVHGLPWIFHGIPRKSTKIYIPHCAGRRILVCPTHSRHICQEIWLHWNIDRTPVNCFIALHHETFHGLSRAYMDTVSWTSMDFHDTLCCFHGLPYTSMEFHGPVMDFRRTFHGRQRKSIPWNIPPKYYHVDDWTSRAGVALSSTGCVPGRSVHHCCVRCEEHGWIAGSLDVVRNLYDVPLDEADVSLAPYYTWRGFHTFVRISIAQKLLQGTTGIHTSCLEECVRGDRLVLP